MSIEAAPTSAGITPAGLVIDGEEQVVLCASLFYFRIPRELWASRLEQVRSSGYRAIDVYLPWNFHELVPGEWDFTGRRDVGAFLDLARDAGLVVVARPGPYICSEWDGGALPAWLGLDPDLRLRQDEPRFLAQVRGWFDHALPLLAERQVDRGGAVVAVQLENELDFFDTADRGGYVGALRELALAAGITVPLVGCAGQGDLHGATGDVDGVVPACNFYPDDASPFVEPEVRAYRTRLADRGLPLLVTETNRRHVTLRRLLVSGASLIAPYLQASGYNMGFTPSVGNWGDPAGLMTHDYDFGGFLSPVGEARPEIVEARVLAAVARTLGSALARGLPQEAVGAYRTGALTSASPSRLVLDGGGWLLGVTNLGADDDVVVLPVSAASEGGSEDEVTVALPAATCLLVTGDLPLAPRGLPGTLVLATADLVGVAAAGLTLASRTASVAVLADDAGASVRVDLDAPAPGAPVRLTATAGAATWEVTVLHPDDVPGPDGVVVADGAGAPAELPAPVRLTQLRRLVRADLPAPQAYDRLPSSEAAGALRGRVHVAADVSGASALLVEGAGDIVDLVLDGTVSTVTPFGASVLLDVAQASRLEATVETWGHPNFDDARLPGLHLGALRGLGRVWSVLADEDVSALWTVEGAEQWAGTPAPVRSLGGWSSTRVGRDLTYRRALELDPGHHHALHLSGLSGAVRVVVDGEDRWVTQENPWLHLEPGSGRDVAVVVPHRPGGLGPARLLRLAEVTGWDVTPEPDTAYLARVRGAEVAGAAGGVAAEGDGATASLPVTVAAGQEVALEVAVPAGGLSLRFEGEAVRVSVVAGEELLGRVWLDDPNRPRFTGGDPGRIWLPAAWNTGAVRLVVRGTSGAPSPVLTGITAQAVRE